MSFQAEMDGALLRMENAKGKSQEFATRLKAECEFAADLARSHRKPAWEKLVLKALAGFNDAVARGGSPAKALADAEKTLAPIGKTAKSCVVHAIGHAHIDMNWTWNWPETVAIVNDTFTTIDRLMEEFPEFTFSQSQASIYLILKDYLPELWERVKARIREGRWEVTASTWVEADKNLSQGEIQCRQLLYTRRFFERELGFPYDKVKIDWECDTFGHSATVPTILATAGVKYYYMHRGLHGPRLFRWKGPDGSSVLVFDDWERAYNGWLDEGLHVGLVKYFEQSKLKHCPLVYGVGDHGGGPTRAFLVNARKLNDWPIYPTIKLSTADAFFSLAEKSAPADLPVVSGEINFHFEGCYTSQSPTKHANRTSENLLVEAEAAALLGRGLVDMPYPAEELNKAWRHAMFNQFHDILPGSGIKSTVEYAQGLFQEIIASTVIVKTRALRSIAARVNTETTCRCEMLENAASGDGVGAGPGDADGYGQMARYAGGGVCCDPFVVFNPSSWTRSEVVAARLWDRKMADKSIAVIDETGRATAAQVVERGHLWRHDYIDVVFRAADVPALGYRTFTVASADDVAPPAAPCTGDGAGVLENEFLRVEIDPASGCIAHLIDKKTGADLVPPGERVGVLEYVLEAAHDMSAWTIGRPSRIVPLRQGWNLRASEKTPWDRGFLDIWGTTFPEKGPYRATAVSTCKFGDSTFTVTISLSAGSPRIEFQVDVNWLERGAPDIGVPSLRIAFPLALDKTRATYEIANGSVERPTNKRDVVSQTINTCGKYFRKLPAFDPNPGEVPALRWADVTGSHADAKAPVGATLLNNCKYGHSIDGNVLRLTLLRSSYDPDPLPEMGRHIIRFALLPHAGSWSVSDATREGAAFNLPFNIVGTNSHAGTLPAKKGFAQVLNPNVHLSGLKKAEDSGALIVRLYEIEGKDTVAKVKFDAALAAPDAEAVETDTLERPLATSTAKMTRGTLNVKVPAFATVTVRIG